LAAHPACDRRHAGAGRLHAEEYAERGELVKPNGCAPNLRYGRIFYAAELRRLDNREFLY
jgi:hypothetical protein